MLVKPHSIFHHSFFQTVKLALQRVFVFFACAAIFLSPLVVVAQTPLANDNLNQVSQAAGMEQGSDLLSLIGKILNVIFGTLGVLLLAYLLYAGFLWMTDPGDGSHVKKAKLVIRNAIVGLVIIVASFAITSFILGLFSGSSSNGDISSYDASGGGVGFPSSASALGKGAIESHIPVRNAKDVPRNTTIIMTFKEAVRLSTIIKDYDDAGTPADLTDDVATTTRVFLQDASVQIVAQSPGAEAKPPLASDQVRVRFTADRRTFVLTPVAYLGSATENTDYSVRLTSKLERETGGALLGKSGYLWPFQVSTKIDTEPPRVVSVIPSQPGLYAPNIVVQINFNEAIDPTSASGEPKEGFTNLSVVSQPLPLSTRLPTLVQGRFTVSNQYRTVEFLADLSCGTNSCLRTVYCLPFKSLVTVTAHAATLDQAPPKAVFGPAGYDGIVDVTGNSLDGNGNQLAEGRIKDDYTMKFSTTDKPNLKPPTILSTVPGMSASNIPVDQEPSVVFDTPLQTSTLTSDTALIKDKEPAEFADTFWFSPRQILLGLEGKPIQSPADLPLQGQVNVSHRVYLPAPVDPKSSPPEYAPFFKSGLQNVYQNCFNPASSIAPKCDGAPFCCDGAPSQQACPYPLP